MAHVQRRGKNRWRARYTAPDGRERSRTFVRRVDAERFLAAVESTKLRGEWRDPRLGRVTFAKWVEEWWQSATMHLKPKTVEGYQSILRRYLLPEFGALPLDRISTHQVRSWLARLNASGLSASRVRNVYRLLSGILRAAVEAEYLARSPCVGVRLPRLPRKEMLILTTGQVRKLAEAMPARYRALVFVLAYGGLRWGEACALRRERCDIDRMRLEIVESLSEVNGKVLFGPTKTYSRRAARIPVFVAELLAEHLQHFTEPGADALVFTSPHGGPLRGPNFRRRVWAPALREAGLPRTTRLHDLRHTCASLLIGRGASVKAVASQLGHSTPTVTLNVYAHLFGDDLDRLYEGLGSEGPEEP